MDGQEFDDNGQPIIDEGVIMSEVTKVVGGSKVKKDLFRKQYNPNISDKNKKLMVDIKDKAEELQNLYEEAGSSRELSLATTNLQQSVFWAISHVTAPGED